VLIYLDWVRDALDRRRFYGGDLVTVELLGDICVVFEDYTNGRRDRLARGAVRVSQGHRRVKPYVINSSSSFVSDFKFLV